MIADEKVDEKSVSPVKYYVFANIMGNHIITVTFKSTGYTKPQTSVK